MSFDAICLKCSIVSERRKHVWSSQGLPLPPSIWCWSDGGLRVDGGVGQTPSLGVRQDGSAMGCRDRDIPFRELLQTHSYLHCVLLLALGGDTDGPRRSFKRRVQGGGWSLGSRMRVQTKRIVGHLTGHWTPVRPSLYGVIVLRLVTLVILNWICSCLKRLLRESREVAALIEVWWVVAKSVVVSLAPPDELWQAADDWGEKPTNGEVGRV